MDIVESTLLWETGHHSKESKVYQALMVEVGIGTGCTVPLHVSGI